MMKRGKEMFEKRKRTRGTRGKAGRDGRVERDKREKKVEGGRVQEKGGTREEGKSNQGKQTWQWKKVHAGNDRKGATGEPEENGGDETAKGGGGKQERKRERKATGREVKVKAGERSEWKGK